jgi:hypothetical protein
MHTRLLPLLLLLVACAGGGFTGPKLSGGERFALYVNGSSTGTPGPYCHVSLYSPTIASVTSHAGGTDSAVTMLNVAPGRYHVSWSVDYYDSGGFYSSTTASLPTDSVSVPGSIYFLC